MHPKTIGVAFITHNSRRHLARCLPPLLASPLSPRVLVVNSSSEDGTVEEARRLGAETLVVPRREFNHGTTREAARRHLGTDVVVMMTPDAYAKDEGTLGHLVAPILSGEAALAFARQIPHQGAKYFEAFPRRFNYPETSHTRSLEDLEKYGAYIVFCSDSCAAWDNRALNEIGGFRPALCDEDNIASAMLLKSGRKVAYVAEAVVSHSHTYGLGDEFRRYFNLGYVRREYRDVFTFCGSPSGHGKKFVRAMLGDLARRSPWLIPYAVANTGAKWLGFRAGKLGYNFPLWLRRFASGSDFYWNSDAFTKMESYRIRKQSPV